MKKNTQSKKKTLFGSYTPPAPIEVTRNEDGKIINVRKVAHIRSQGNKQYAYNATKGWRVVSKYHTHSLLNKLFMNAGYGNIYSDETLKKAYGW